LGVRKGIATPPGLEYFSPMSRAGKNPPMEDYEDDPERGIYWGPKQPNGMMTRWSRPWFDWRIEYDNELEVELKSCCETPS
jgi:hypothetical protein